MEDIKVIESYGKCVRCRFEATLGDGLCMKCWDTGELPEGERYRLEESARREREELEKELYRVELKKQKEEADRREREERVERVRAEREKVARARSKWGKVGAWVDKSVPTPDGVVMIDSRGFKYRVKFGRKHLGEWRDCIGCGRPIFVRKHRLEAPNIGKRCAPCNRKVYLPPVGMRWSKK